MSSEAAKKVFPDDELHTEEEVALKTLERQAFDRGAVEALRQAAEKVEAAIRDSDHCDCGNVEVDWDDLDMAWIWRVGQ